MKKTLLVDTSSEIGDENADFAATHHNAIKFPPDWND
jgi:hypothetical protein